MAWLAGMVRDKEQCASPQQRPNGREALTQTAWWSLLSVADSNEELSLQALRISTYGGLSGLVVWPGSMCGRVGFGEVEACR